MKLFTAAQEQKLRTNGKRQAERLQEDGNCFDFFPVVKLFTPDGACTWLLSEIDAEDPDIAFGLCDLGMGVPELGTVSLSELAAVRGRLGLPVERDLHFEADKPISAYADEAHRLGRISA